MRETFWKLDDGTYVFRAGGRWNGWKGGDPKWTSGRFLPRHASRIRLRINDVRLQPLQTITEQDAEGEGVVEGLIPADDYGPPRIGYVAGRDDGKCVLYPTRRHAFEVAWDTINGHIVMFSTELRVSSKKTFARWAENPIVWAITFSRKS